ncbi:MULTISPECIES: DUF4097 family beta strand repeat-containing protein [unclassified Streptomyces]|uniref:DUF4097 family beta strand repeat-containing protein n=1 Tax=unclassified Streptomyces TaxID=2593676 RepID=UPI0029BD003B|nr:DUF4097 family beta strand repeat-containing protein [Streptomyces sp. FL07-04A]MDX3577589.1 DUF4097 family beta strand repeat-containing protein [Streptomyces sp. FL07-04A]
MSEWSVAEPGKLSFDEPVSELHVRIVEGAVNVVGADEGPARLEVSEVDGPPLVVSHRDGTLTVAYEDLPWKGFLKWLDRKGRRRRAVVSLAVPAGARVEVGVVSAAAVLSGIDGHAEVKGVNGDTTLVGLAGPVRADTVSGSVEAQALTGDLHFHSVSGDLTVVEAGSCVKADSVSGSMIVDLDPASRPTRIDLTSVSGEIAIRLPHPADAQVEANTASGSVSNAFEDLRVSGQWGAKRITGRLGAGNGRLRATTVTGSIALLRRPPTEDAAEAGDAAQYPTADTREDGRAEAHGADRGPQERAGAPSRPGDNAVSGPGGEGSLSDPADSTTDKKVL